jgi:hypothetical protein
MRRGACSNPGKTKTIIFKFLSIRGGGARVLEEDLCRKRAKTIEKIRKNMKVGVFSSKA